MTALVAALIFAALAMQASFFWGYLLAQIPSGRLVTPLAPVPFL